MQNIHQVMSLTYSDITICRVANSRVHSSGPEIFTIVIEMLE